MNWKDLISEKISRKARIVLIGIAALVYVHSQICSVIAESENIEPSLALWTISWTIGGIIGISIAGIVAQWSIEYYCEDQKKAGTPEQPQPAEQPENQE